MRREIPSNLDSSSRHSPKHHHNNNKIYLLQLLIHVSRIAVLIILILPVVVVGLYSLVASPPLHLIYEKPFQHAGRNSVYVPGSGFAGFWYHLGIFHTLFDDYHDKHPFNNFTEISKNHFVNSETNYYCYSSGCLSLLLASFDGFAKGNRSYSGSSGNGVSVMDDAYIAAIHSQKGWLNGTLNKYDIVDKFLDSTVVKPIQEGHIDGDKIIQTLLPRFHVLITSVTEGVEVRTARTISELVTLLKRTTWIPFVTGNGFGSQGRNDAEWFLDGGFSRMIHPECEYTVSVPITWKTTIHGLNPGMGRDSVLELWNMGITDGKILLNDKEEGALNTIDPLKPTASIEIGYSTYTQSKVQKGDLVIYDTHDISEQRHLPGLFATTKI